MAMAAEKDGYVVMGNIAKLNAEGRNDWTFYVKGAKYIEEVVVELHTGSYDQPMRVLRGADLSLPNSGWGEFELQVDI